MGRVVPSIPSAVVVGRKLLPAVPPAMAMMWFFGILPGSLALAFALQEGGGFLWTLRVWRAEQKVAARIGGSPR